MKTKNSTFKSLIALLLCVAMLAGTTYAWFTDVATSKDNTIQAGTLDVTMEWANSYDASTWQDATQGAIFTHNNWEPGYTDVKYIKISNKGDLNLKWRLSLEAEGIVSKLSDVIGVYCVNPATGNLTSLDGLTSAGKLTNVLNNTDAFAPTGKLAPEASVIVAIAMHMDEEAGNEYKGLSLCNAGFSVKLEATQDVGESDSFGDQYDNDAEWPDFKMNFEATTSLAGVGTTYDGTLAEDVIIRHESGAYAIVPAGTKLAAGATELKFTGKNVNANGNFADPTQSYDIHIAGIADDNQACITVFLGKILEAGLGETGLKFYHEDVPMTRVNSVDDFASPNQYTYNAETGAVTLYVKNFSVFSAVKTTADVWDGTSDATWYNENDTEFTLTTAEQFAGFRDLVDAGTTFAGKTVKLATDIDLDKKLFNPIGFGYTYNKPSTTAFMGIFDGGNHTVYNLYQNGWDLDEDKVNYSTYTYSTAGGGLFASIENATIKNLAVSGANIVFECVDIGIVVGYAQGNCHFENIVVTNSTIANYNRATGGVVGEVCYGSYGTDVSQGYSHTFKNIVVDSSVVVSSLWGSFDTLCGGVIGGKWGDATVKMENVIVAAELDVFSDVTAAYQWYAYRRCGMLIGHTEQNSPKKALNAAAEFLTCQNVTVYYGDWTNYTYYQFTNQDIAWQNNYPWVRAEAGKNTGAFSNARYGNPIVNGVAINTKDLAEANKTDYTPIIFGQLYGGGQGVYGCNEHAGVKIYNNLENAKTVYIKNNLGWENLKLYYWFANGNDTWTTLIDGLALTEENGVYRVNLPAYVYAFTITADGEDEPTEFIISGLIDGALYGLDGAHIHDYQWIVDRAPTDKLEGIKHEKCTACGDIRNENTPIEVLGCPDHILILKAAIPATCTTAGNKAYYTCRECKRIYADASGYVEIHEKDYEIPSLGGHKINDDGDCTVCGEKINATITFKAGNSTYDGEIAAPLIGLVGETIILPNLPSIEGWYTDKNCTTLFKGTTFSENLTLYAKQATPAESEKITIMSYNAGASSSTSTKPEHNAPIWYSIWAAQKHLGGDPDIICLQRTGTEWMTQSISNYEVSLQNNNGDNKGADPQWNKNIAKYLIYYNKNKFTAIASGLDAHCSYVVLQRKDGTQFAVVNAWFDNSDAATQQAELDAIWKRINGFWQDANRGLMPIIITGSLTAGTDVSNVYQNLTDSTQFFDTSEVAKSSTGNATTGDYVFASYHMQYAVEEYAALTQYNGRHPVVVKVAFPKACSHILTKTDAVDATCTTVGRKEYYTCETCKNLFADEHAMIQTTLEKLVIPALGHNWLAATCTDPKTCSVCHATEGDALGHAYTNDCDPDCNNSCGETREPSHYYQWVVDEAAGVKHEECTNCHEKRNENTPIEESTEPTSP